MPAIVRSSLMGSYVNNVVEYLKYQWPNLPQEKIEAFVKDHIKKHIHRPTATIITYPEEGEQAEKKIDMLAFIKQYNNKTIAPYGTIFETTDKKVPMIKEFADYCVSQRDITKKQMLMFKKQGKTDEAEAANAGQNAKKIAANSISGGQGAKFSAFNDPESYNAITSLCRHGTMMAYTFAERFLSGNYYFPHLEDCINYVIIALKKCPPVEELRKVIDTFHLQKVTSDEIEDILTSGMRNAGRVNKRGIAKFKRDVLDHISWEKLTFVYYARSLYNLYKQNSTLFTKYFDDLFTLDTNESCIQRTDVDVTYLRKMDGDLLQAMQLIYSQYLTEYSLDELADKNPELGLLMAKIAKTMDDKIKEFSPVIDMFLHADIVIPKAQINKYMIRKSIPVSDTDSIIYTTKHLLELYLHGEFTFSNPNINKAHALFTYYLCKSVASLLRRIAIDRGAVGENNIKMLKMKNEFLYPIFIRTNYSKHYVGYRTVQEGVVLPKPELDIKGLGFRTSNIPKVSQNFVNDMIADVFSDLMSNTKIYSGTYIARALEYEKTIYNAIMSGSQEYYTNQPVRPANEYANAEISTYAVYVFWQEVFAEKYGDIILPNKCPVIPFITNKYKNKQYLNWLSMKSPSIYEKYEQYRAKHPKRNITRIVIPVGLKVVPEEIVPLINARSIIYKNTKPTQLLLKSLGVDLGNMKQEPLFMDYYSDILEKSL